MQKLKFFLASGIKIKIFLGSEMKIKVYFDNTDPDITIQAWI
jgi:hypothetical protein